MRLNPSTTCADVKRRAEAKIADIEGKIRSLRRMKKALQDLNESCQGRGPVEDCPILESLETGQSKTDTESSDTICHGNVT